MLHGCLRYLSVIEVMKLYQFFSIMCMYILHVCTCFHIIIMCALCVHVCMGVCMCVCTCVCVCVHACEKESMCICRAGRSDLAAPV